MKQSKTQLLIPVMDQKQLETIASSRTEPVSRVLRANILLLYSRGKKITEITRSLNTTRPLVYRAIDKALEFGPLQSLADLQRSGRTRTIDDGARQWVISIACQKPTSLGYAAETWTYQQLVLHIQKHAAENGYQSLLEISRSTVHDILSENEIKPHKIRYYLERRDPKFEEKMIDILHVYKDVEMINQAPQEARESATISFDEKPGIQAIKNISAQLQPVPGEYSSIGRDYEYKRLGTVSLLGEIGRASCRERV
jgi:transposase